MKIIFDIDGTLTDYNKFIKQYAIPYYCKKFHMKIQYPNELEIEDIFGMNQLPMGEQERLLNKFWNSHYFLLFSLLGRFRRGTGSFLRKLKQQGYQVAIYTSVVTY